MIGIIGFLLILTGVTEEFIIHDVSLALAFVSGVLFLRSAAKDEKKIAEARREWKNKNYMRIEVDLSEAAVMSRDHYETFYSGERGRSYEKVVTEHIHKSYFAVEAEINGVKYHYMSPRIGMDETTLRFKLVLRKKGIIYVNPSDPEDVVFDLRFLSENS